MTRRIPVVATIIVAGAVALMAWLGFWQLQRAEWKEALIARYVRAEAMPPISWPVVFPSKDQLPLFRHATGVCLQPVGKRAVAGENAAGDPGYVQIVDCRTGAEGPGMSVQIGWSKNPNAKADWSGGPVSGIIVPDRRSGMRLIAATPARGLEASRVPDVATVSPVTPFGHRMYAATWFALALIAAGIYALALAKHRNKEQPTP